MLLVGTVAASACAPAAAAAGDAGSHGDGSRGWPAADTTDTIDSGVNTPSAMSGWHARTCIAGAQVLARRRHDTASMHASCCSTCSSSSFRLENAHKQASAHAQPHQSRPLCQLARPRRPPRARPACRRRWRAALPAAAPPDQVSQTLARRRRPAAPPRGRWHQAGVPAGRARPARLLLRDGGFARQSGSAAAAVAGAARASKHTASSSSQR